MPFMRPVQVDSRLYGSARYMSEDRWFSYARQFFAIRACAPASCLEIGIGNGITAYALRRAGIAVTTCDIDASLSPDHIGSVTRMPFPDESFDCVLCAEVLEHIPFEDFPFALRELYRVTKRHCVITIPYPAITFAFSVRIPLFRRKFFMISIPLFWRRHAWNGEHYWEMGMRGFSRRTVTRCIADAGFRINALPVSDNDPYHALFILEKKFLS